jgi:hypothetical protein
MKILLVGIRRIIAIINNGDIELKTVGSQILLIVRDNGFSK